MMQVLLSPKAIKSFAKINELMKSRIIGALARLEHEPMQGDIKSLSGQNGYRVRVGEYRIMFTIVNGVITIANIAPRGGAYKRR
ncbi:hypothetical protein FACS189481_2800 [Clostridia bacterium]|nr:hypothetical protein FACS189481_2800 [Clostridia bacterium]